LVFKDDLDWQGYHAIEFFLNSVVKLNPPSNVKKYVSSLIKEIKPIRIGCFHRMMDFHELNNT
jgi:hypothetical protein